MTRSFPCCRQTGTYIESALERQCENPITPFLSSYFLPEIIRSFEWVCNRREGKP
jgi:hypothetical protein